MKKILVSIQQDAECMMRIKTKQHFHPIWREDANFLIGARFFDSNNQLVIHEQIWARPRRLVSPRCPIPYGDDVAACLHTERAAQVRPPWVTIGASPLQGA